MLYAEKSIITREQAEALTKLALELEAHEIELATDERKEEATDLAQLHRQGAWRLISAAFDERK